MKIAIFSDVHANIQAMEAVWDDIQQQDPDEGAAHPGPLRQRVAGAGEPLPGQIHDGRAPEEDDPGDYC